MRRLAGNLARRLVATTMVAVLTLCCCHVQGLAHAFSDPAAGPVATAGCCATSPCGADDAPDDSRPATPDDGCNACCIKGTGLKDRPTPLPAMLPVWAPALEAPDVAALTRATTPAPSLALDLVVRLEPPTLLRLRCALIV